MNSESPWSPSWISTTFFGNWRTTPDDAIARRVPSGRGASGSAGAMRVGTGVDRSSSRGNPSTRNDERRASAILYGGFGSMFAMQWDASAPAREAWTLATALNNRHLLGRLPARVQDPALRQRAFFFKEIDHGQGKSAEQSRTDHRARHPRKTSNRWRRAASDRWWRAPSADHEPGGRALRQSKLAQGQFARSYTIGGFHPPRENYPFRSRAYSGANRSCPRDWRAWLLRADRLVEAIHHRQDTDRGGSEDARVYAPVDCRGRRGLGGYSA